MHFVLLFYRVTNPNSATLVAVKDRQTRSPLNAPWEACSPCGMLLFTSNSAECFVQYLYSVLIITELSYIIFFMYLCTGQWSSTSDC